MLFDPAIRFLQLMKIQSHAHEPVGSIISGKSFITILDMVGQKIVSYGTSFCKKCVFNLVPPPILTRKSVFN